MAGFQQSGDAGGAQHAVIGRVHRNDAIGFRIIRVGEQAGHGGANRIGHHLGQGGEIGAGGIGELHREFVPVHGDHGGGEIGDGVIRARHAAVAAGVGGFDPEILHRLFAHLHGQALRLAIGAVAAAAAFVQREFGHDQFGAVLGQPIRAVEGVGRLLPAGQRQLDGAFWRLAGLHADQEIGPNAGLRLIVEGAAAIEIAVFLDQFERAARPVFRLGGDHIEVAEQQHRFHLRIAALQMDNDAAILGELRHAELGDVGIAEACRFEAHGEFFGCRGAAAGGDAGVGLHHFLEQRTELRLVGLLADILGLSCGAGEQGSGEEERAHWFILTWQRRR